MFTIYYGSSFVYEASAGGMFYSSANLFSLRCNTPRGRILSFQKGLRDALVLANISLVVAQLYIIMGIGLSQDVCYFFLLCQYPLELHFQLI